ncbi:MAG: glutathione peroxidase [Ignavibacteriae bacterium]|nr:MAG: glutathione peroxidase [Ignavibacteriota bacterium]
MFVPAQAKEKLTENEPPLYSFTMKTIDGKDKPLSEYKGKVLMIVNVASKCGHTPQYKGLEALYEKYKARGFVILGFPANNFLFQEPGTNEDIKKFCTLNYGVTFDMFSKISVKGDDQHPLYHYLTVESPVPGAVKWNFQKYLVDRHGNVVQKFAPGTEPTEKEVADKIESLLSEK